MKTCSRCGGNILPDDEVITIVGKHDKRIEHADPLTCNDLANDQ